MNTHPQKLNHPVIRTNGERATRICVSLYPVHLQMLRARADQLRVTPSVIFQTFLEVDDSQGLLPREMTNRWKASTRKGGQQGTQP